MIRVPLLALLVFALFGAEPPAANDFRFAIIGDRTGETVSGVYEQVWREVTAEKPDFTINVGDVIQGGGDATVEAEWRRVRTLLPTYLVPGNHDIWSVASRRIYEKESRRAAYYSFNRQNAHFTVLDNSGSLYLSDAQMQFLEKDLTENKAREPKFVLFHQPFWLIPLKLRNMDLPFHKLMVKYGVSYVISGHVHQFSRMERDGIVYMVVGSSGGHLRGNDPFKDFEKGWFFHHVRARVRGQVVEMRVKEIDPPFGKGREFKAEDWGEFGMSRRQ